MPCARLQMSVATSSFASAASGCRHEYAAEGVFWVTPEARWHYLNQLAKQPEIGKLIDHAMDLIRFRRSTPGLASTSAASPSSSTCFRLPGKDILGCVYEYFLGWCASAGTKGRGEFYTHQYLDKLLVEMLEPMNRRVYDGCCGWAAWSCRPSGSSKLTAANAELLPTSGSSPHTCPSSSASCAGPGLVHSSKPGTTVTYTLSHPLVVDLLTVARSRLHEVINDRIKSLTGLQTDFAGQ
jgi:N-6 DNA Methylase